MEYALIAWKQVSSVPFILDINLHGLKNQPKKVHWIDFVESTPAMCVNNPEAVLFWEIHPEETESHTEL